MVFRDKCKSLLRKSAGYFNVCGSVALAVQMHGDCHSDGEIPCAFVGKHLHRGVLHS